MCYSAPVSIAAWILANTIALYLWFRNRNYDRWNALFIATFTLIQLVEAGLWANLCDVPMNVLLTSFIVPLLLLQPLVQSSAGYYYTRQWFLLVLAVVFLVLLFGSAFHMSKTSTTVGPHGHLAWTPWSSSLLTIIYVFGLFVPLFFQGKLGYPLIAVVVLTILWAFIAARGKEFSSMWCFFAVLYAIVALFI